MYPEVASQVTGAVVFQTHIPGRQNLNWANEFKLAIEKVENKIANELEIYAQSRSGFSFELKPLQDPHEGIVERDIDIELDGENQSLGLDGHATRYYAIFVKSTRPAPPAPKTLAEQRALSSRTS